MMLEYEPFLLITGFEMKGNGAILGCFSALIYRVFGEIFVLIFDMFW
jgi:hypothetical protein